MKSNMYTMYANLFLTVGHFGAVSALDINADGTRLLCGYAKGLVWINSLVLYTPSL